jgi:hypothetical protein
MMMKRSHYAACAVARSLQRRDWTDGGVPVTLKPGKLSDFELPVRVGRVNVAAILSELRSPDDQARSILFQGKLPSADIADANRRVHMIFP